MRRATKITLLVMGGSAVTLGTLAQIGGAQRCQSSPPPANVKAADVKVPAANGATGCGASGSGGHFGYTGGDSRPGSGTGGTAAPGASARGGFGASGAAHGGE